jgi:hypothetical protein
MLPIICNGKGLIPRVGMIAPIFTPFKVDYQTLTIIMRTPGSALNPYFVDPDTSAQTALTNTNWKSIYEKYQQKLAAPKPVETVDKKVASFLSNLNIDGNTNNSAKIEDDNGQEATSDGADNKSNDMTFTPITKPDGENVNNNTTGDNAATIPVIQNQNNTDENKSKNNGNQQYQNQGGKNNNNNYRKNR